MREIKFRAWNGKKMLCSGFSLHRDGQIEPGYHHQDLTIDSPLMQFTGLTDNHGNEIYEGDIVRAASHGVHATCEVKWGQGRAGFFLYREIGCICWNLSGGGLDYDQETVEVIGNIHTTPELMT